MDARTIETRLRELSDGADMISMKHITKYTGTSADWVLSRMREAEKRPIGKGSGARWHIRDVAKALET